MRFAGPNGCCARRGYRRELNCARSSWPASLAERDRLRHRSALLDPKKADPDLADEMVRKDLGTGSHPDEVILSRSR